MELISSVLASLHIYWSSAFRLPEKILKSISLSIRDFFWSGPEPTYKIHTISYRYEVTVIRETGLPDHALVSDLIQNGHWNLLPSRRMAGQCLMQEIALYELPQLPVEDRIVWSLSPDGN